LTEKLKKQGVDAGVLHGGRTQKQRMRVLDAFKIGKKPALIATDVAARGIHVDDVSLVVHVDPPETHKDYLHRAGRTARAGAKGTVVSIASSGNRKRVHNLGKEAGVKMTETRIESRNNNLHPELMRITGAQEPSGVPVADKVVTRSERSKPGRKKFDDRKPRRDREDKKASTGPNRIQRRAHLQPADRPVKTRHEKRTKGSSKSKPKRTGKPAARKSGNRKQNSRSRAGR
jgi:superfamily II DNA/RNA helicase